MQITISTPAILFSTVSLVYIAYTNRFIALSNLVRGLKDRYLQSHDPALILQIANLRRRIILIRNMQLYGISSLLLSVVSILLLFAGQEMAGAVAFCLSLAGLSISILMAGREILISVEALNIELSSVEELNQELEEGGMLGEGLKKISRATRQLFVADEHDPEEPGREP